ncbi:MAG: nickel pincer cofactor biosynthesis protein LarC, partial [Candidatus Krumholzibacteria bacterium]|nr:nickel pincer cofactor biosynthesis protein LarC [Candidatus Krumholzibacteria bacterium]
GEVARQIATMPGLEKFHIVSGRVKRRGVTAVRARVVCPDKARPRDLRTILSMISRSKLDKDVKEAASKAFIVLGKAEGKIHGVPTDHVHFHEVGAVDSIVDIVGTAVALSLLGFPKLYHRPFILGSGTITFSHGTLPLPAPATLEVLKGRTISFGTAEGEVVTPTGAALAVALAGELPADMPLNVEKVVYSAGTREKGGAPGILRAAACSGPDVSSDGRQGGGGTDEPRGLVTIIRTTIDDMTPELFGYVQEKLLEDGALDVFMSSVAMKKNRPGILLTVLCQPGSEERLVGALFRETTTIGVRIGYEERIELKRSTAHVDTPFGRVAVKRASIPGGGVKTAPEYESCRKAAKKYGVTVREVFEAATAASIMGKVKKDGKKK